MLNSKTSAEDRFILRVYHCPVTGCWIWTGSGTRYGNFMVNGKAIMTHRWAWEQKNGPVPDGLVLDHYRCENTKCCNPDHLRPVTPRENALRGNTVTSANAAKDKCPKCGSEFTPFKGGRYCKPCQKERCRIWGREKYRKDHPGSKHYAISKKSAGHP